MTLKKISLNISNPAYLKDHCYEGKSILPAVESLQYLAMRASGVEDPADVLCSHNAHFNRFLALPSDMAFIEAFAELRPHEKRRLLTATLATKKQAGNTGISRSLNHVEVTFGLSTKTPMKNPFDLYKERVVALDGMGIRFSSRTLYDDLVAFGPSFQNVTGPVFLSRAGAVATVFAADHPAPTGPLGNGFVLDGAFHLACAWGQRYEGLLTFPVGYRQRVINFPCKTGEKYWCRVLPAGRKGQVLFFNIFVFSRNGVLAESCMDVEFRDVSSGRISPPSWIRQNANLDPLARLRDVCTGLSVLELESMSDFYQFVFTEHEKKRWQALGKKRARDFGSARIALKLLARQLVDDWTSPGSKLETLSKDLVHPILPLEYDSSRYCAASHDPRFAIAVSSQSPIGVDVEKLSEKALRSSTLFLSEAEQILVSKSAVGAAEAAIRVWTVKEAAAKALDISLAKTFDLVQVVQIGKDECEVIFDNHHYKAVCAQVDDHVFTIFSTSASD